MSKNRTVSANQLADNTTFLIRGRVLYSRIRSQVAGEELARQNQRAMQQGRQPRNRPYTTLSICQAEVVRANPNAPVMNPEEIFATESLYTSTTQPNNGLCYSADNTGNYLPRLCVQNGNMVTELGADEIHGELDNGLLVTMVMRVYNSGKPNKGITLDTVIVNEPIRFYQGGAAANLEKYGLTVNLQPNRQQAAAPAQTAPTVGGPQPAYPAQAPMQAPAQAPMQAPQAPAPGVVPNNVGYGYTPGMDTMPFGQGQAPAGAPVNPYGAPAGAPVNPYGAPAGAPVGAPVAAPDPNGAPGIMYDPNAPERAY